MKSLRLDWLNDLLRGMLNGTLELQVVERGIKEPGKRGRPRKIVESPSKAKESGKAEKPRRGRPPGKKAAKAGKAAKASGASARKPGPRGRKPLTESARAKKTAKEKAIKARLAKRAVPSVREIFLFLQGKIEGRKLTDLTREFGVNREPLKVLLDKLVKKGDLDTLKGRFYLHRRLRPRGEKKTAQGKPQPIAETTVLDYLMKRGAVTMQQMAADLGEPSFHRLIKVMNGLKKAGKVVAEGKRYWLATFVQGPATEPALETTTDSAASSWETPDDGDGLPAGEG